MIANLYFRICLKGVVGISQASITSLAIKSFEIKTSKIKADQNKRFFHFRFLSKIETKKHIHITTNGMVKALMVLDRKKNINQR
jgi:hypothetical protein